MNVTPNQPSLWGFINFMLWTGTGISLGEYSQPRAIREIAFYGDDQHIPCVYFLRANRRIKIGHTRDILERMNILQNMNSGSLELIGVIPGDAELEHQIHSNFYRLRLHGEWFIEHTEIYKFINVATKEWTSFTD